HIGKRKHCDRRLVGQRECWSAFDRRHFGRSLNGATTYPMDLHRSGNVLEALLSHVVEGEVETPGYVLLNTGGHTNTSRLGQTFQTGCNIHPVTKDVVVLYNNVALVNANPELDAIIVRCGGI